MIRTAPIKQITKKVTSYLSTSTEVMFVQFALVDVYDDAASIQLLLKVESSNNHCVFGGGYRVGVGFLFFP
jgi:hypothetical protein